MPLLKRLALTTLLLAGNLSAAEPLSFNEDIRPILSDNCFACHGTDAKHRKGDRRMDTAEGAFADIDGVRAIVPGDLAKSDAWLRIISEDPDEVMPPPKSHKKPLTPEQRAVIKRWIEEGAKYQRHWAFEPVVTPEIPAAAGGAGEHPVDRFIGAKLAAKGLAFAPEASPEILLRRVTLGLTGLPPTLAELDAFLAQPDYAAAVDRLLASPRYGEHFARGWLDAVRYADTHGMHYDNERSIWPYRDWVVRALNENQPFDQFTTEQLAGDLLPKPTQRQLVASGYNRALITTNEGGSIAEEVLAQYTGDRAGTTAGVWLGLTAACATCHDHKFDPLTQKEYYEFGAFFRGLADSVWDANVKLPGPVVLLADAAQEQRIEAIAAELPAKRATLAARAQELVAQMPAPKKGAVTYEVVCAEDGDVPVPGNLDGHSLAGTWRGGPGVPLAGGSKALRLEGKVERVVRLGAGDVTLYARKTTKAFAHVALDPAQPPRAISLEFVAEGKTQRVVWGEAKAFGEEVAKNAVHAGPLPLAGTYARLEIEAAATGVDHDTEFTGLRLAQSGGAAWWDRLGLVRTTTEADKDPLLSAEAWKRLMSAEHRRYAGDYPLEVTQLVRQPDYFTSAAEKKLLTDYHRDFIYGPTRGALEAEHHAARRLLAEQVHFEKTLPGTLISREMAEPHPSFVLLRGQYDKHGEAVQPGTPAFLPPLEKSGARASRLDLARWLVSGRNPLTARVAVNRIWQQVFGAGLVRTPGDFGAQGEPPTHAALLDWLAADFVAHGWDVKRLVRQLVTTRTYRQEARATPALLERDPENRLWARGPRHRLDAEVLRDQALALSGLLQPALGGPPVRPYQPEGLWQAVSRSDSNTYVYTPDTGPALYRRSLYSFWKRTAPPPALATFDAPSRESFCVRRDRTNTPLQALALMNDPQQFESARVFAERLLSAEGDESARLARAFRSVTARAPTEAENTLLAKALATQRAHFAKDPAAAKKALTVGASKPAAALPEAEFAAWTMVANLLLNLDETINLN